MFRKVFGTAATSLLVVAAVAVALWFVYSAASGATLVTFRTGSMSPAMPQGSLAVTVPVSASELEVGDVVTLQRVGESMPITHRVVEISEIDPPAANAPDIRAAAPDSGPPDLSSANARRIVMQGDDNKSPDHLPYAITDARKVVFSAPRLGAVLMTLQSPIGVGTLALLAGALVVWVFWPAPKPESSDADRPTRTEEVPT